MSAPSGTGHPDRWTHRTRLSWQNRKTPLAATGVAANEPQGLIVGQSVTVIPDVNGGEQPVAGTLRYADAQTVTIERTADDVGTLCVHFPRSGYRIDIV